MCDPAIILKNRGHIQNVNQKALGGFGDMLSVTLEIQSNENGLL